MTINDIQPQSGKPQFGLKATSVKEALTKIDPIKKSYVDLKIDPLAMHGSQYGNSQASINAAEEEKIQLFGSNKDDTGAVKDQALSNNNLRIEYNSSVVTEAIPATGSGGQGCDSIVGTPTLRPNESLQLLAS